jgi:lipopolysaccharide transport protein LptA
LLGSAAEETGEAISTNRFIEVTAQHHELRTNLAVFRGGVRVADLEEDEVLGTLQCGVLTVSISASNEVQQIIAQDDVAIEQNETRFAAARAVVSGTNGLIEFTGNPSWQLGERQGGGDVMFVDRSQNSMRVMGRAWMKLPREEIDTEVLAEREVETDPPEPEEQFVTISSDEYEFKQGAGAFRGDVRIQTAQTTMSCALLTIHSAPEGGQVEKIIAEGGVVMDSVEEDGDTTRATGSRAIYLMSDNVVELTGNPRVERGQGSLTGDIIIWDRANDILAVKNQTIYFQPAPGATNLFGDPRLQ